MNATNEPGTIRDCMVAIPSSHRRAVYPDVRRKNTRAKEETGSHLLRRPARVVGVGRALFQKVLQVPPRLFFLLFLLPGRRHGRRVVLLLVVALAVAATAVRTAVLLALLAGRAVLVHGHIAAGLVGPGKHTVTPRLSRRSVEFYGSWVYEIRPPRGGYNRVRPTSGRSSNNTTRVTTTAHTNKGIRPRYH